jgi:hypothetical protein
VKRPSTRDQRGTAEEATLIRSVARLTLCVAHNAKQPSSVRGAQAIFDRRSGERRAPTDSRWFDVARWAGVKLAVTARIVRELQGRASRGEDPRSIAGLDAETIAAGLRRETREVEAVIGALRAKGDLVDDRFSDRAFEARSETAEKEEAARGRYFYRAAGTITDPQLHKAAAIARVPLWVSIAVMDAICERACRNSERVFDSEPVEIECIIGGEWRDPKDARKAVWSAAAVDRVLDAFRGLGMVDGRRVVPDAKERGGRSYRHPVDFIYGCRNRGVALSAHVPRGLASTVWGAILGNACALDRGGAYDATPEWIAGVLKEPVEPIERLFEIFAGLEMVEGGCVADWEKWQPARESAASAAQRQRKSRARRKAIKAALGPDPSPRAASPRGAGTSAAGGDNRGARYVSRYDPSRRFGSPGQLRAFDGGLEDELIRRQTGRRPDAPWAREFFGAPGELSEGEILAWFLRVTRAALRGQASDDVIAAGYERFDSWAARDCTASDIFSELDDVAKRLSSPLTTLFAGWLDDQVLARRDGRRAAERLLAARVEEPRSTQGEAAGRPDEAPSVQPPPSVAASSHAPAVDSSPPTPRAALDAAARELWRAYGEGRLTDADAEALSEALARGLDVLPALEALLAGSPTAGAAAPSHPVTRSESESEERREEEGGDTRARAHDREGGPGEHGGRGAIDQDGRQAVRQADCQVQGSPAAGPPSVSSALDEARLAGSPRPPPIASAAAPSHSVTRSESSRSRKGRGEKGLDSARARGRERGQGEAPRIAAQFARAGPPGVSPLLSARLTGPPRLSPIAGAADRQAEGGLRTSTLAAEFAAAGPPSVSSALEARLTGPPRPPPIASAAAVEASANPLPGCAVARCHTVGGGGGGGFGEEQERSGSGGGPSTSSRARETTRAREGPTAFGPRRPKAAPCCARAGPPGVSPLLAGPRGPPPIAGKAERRAEGGCADRAGPRREPARTGEGISAAGSAVKRCRRPARDGPDRIARGKASGTMRLTRLSAGARRRTERPLGVAEPRRARRR